MGEPIRFRVKEGRLCIAKLPAAVDMCSLERTFPFFSVTCTGDEISLIAEEHFAHPEAEIERGWRGIEVIGPLAFELKGILVSFLNPLNEDEISVFAISTYSTDYIFVKDYHLDLAVAALEKAGHLLVQS